MKIIKIRTNLIVAAFAGLLVVSCKKEYLDKVPYNALPLATSISTEVDMNTVLTGVYSGLRATDLFGRTLSVKAEVMSDNAFVTTSNSGRYLTPNNFVFSATDAYAAGIWQNAYVVIKNANNVINSTLATSTNVNQYRGEALAIRALMYFELVRNFGKPFTIDPTSAGVPIVLTFDYTALPARNTVKEVYAQIIKDLEAAYPLLTSYRGSAYFSKYAARALEARVYQNMGDWANAKTTALDVITNSGWTMSTANQYSLASGSPAAGNYSPGGYWANPVVQSTGKNETMFEVASDLLNNNGFDQIGFIYLTVGGGYGDILANSDVYNLYSSTDARKALMATGTRSGQPGTSYFNYKYPNPANGADKDDTKVLRIADIYLIAAEAYYNAGDIINANFYLNKVAQQRDPAFAGWADIGTQVLEDILVERRKELAFEGSRYWDLVRLGRSWIKIKNLSPLTTISVTPASPYLIMPIPQSERDANSNISQNPGY